MDKEERQEVILQSKINDVKKSNVMIIKTKMHQLVAALCRIVKICPTNEFFKIVFLGKKLWLMLSKELVYLTAYQLIGYLMQ